MRRRDEIETTVELDVDRTTLHALKVTFIKLQH